MQRRPSEIRRIEWLVWGALGLTVAGILAAFFMTRFQQQGETLRKPLIIAGRVGNFTLTNQLNQPVSLSNFFGKVWVADVIFSRCPISCEQMTRRMAALANQFAREPVWFASITADPEFDRPDILRKYAERHQARPERWQFLTGPKRDVYRLAVNELKFTVIDKTQEQQEAPDDLFLHSTQFVLVDKRGQIRGYFEGAEPEGRQQLVLAIKQLLQAR